MSISMHAVVTGATGFLGKHLVRVLQQQGWRVTALGRQQRHIEDLLDYKTTFQYCDITDKQSVIDAMPTADVVFHCAAFSKPWGPSETFAKTNVDGTKHVVDTAKQVGIKRLVYVSSSSVYFQYKNQQHLAETAQLPQHFINDYARTKFKGEQIVRQAHTAHFETVIIRPRGIFGEEDASIMPRILRLSKRNILPLFKSGKAVIDITYVGNVVDAMLLAATSKKAIGQCYNISNQEPKTVKSIFELMINAFHLQIRFVKLPYPVMHHFTQLLERYYFHFKDNEPPITCYTLGLLAFDQTLDNTKSQKELKFYPKVSIEEGILRYAKWYQDSQIT